MFAVSTKVFSLVVWNSGASRPANFSGPLRC